METIEKLYDEYENAHVRFVGLTTEHIRYDFGIVYSNLFFGKPLVVCMQTGRSTLLSAEDLHDLDHLQSVFKIDNRSDVINLTSFFAEILPSGYLHAQYD